MNDVPSINFMSPEGKSLFAKVVEPDFKYKDLGEFSIIVLVPADAAAPLVQAIDELFEENIEYWAEKLGKRKAKASVHRPYFTEYERDDEGNETDVETGNIGFKFKRPHQVKRRKDGKIVTLPPPALFDAGGKPCMGTEIGNGSTVCVKAEARGWNNESLGCGVKIDFPAIQILDLKTGGNQETFESSGFEVREDGFSSKEEGEFTPGEGIGVGSGEPDKKGGNF